MSKFKNSGLFKTVGKAATIRGSTGPTEYFEFVHEECGQKTGFLKFLDSEETSYKSSGKNVAYRVGSEVQGSIRDKDEFFTAFQGGLEGKRKVT
jgi:hypothetical protein